MKYGINITLVSDAGVPCISDPGYKLVERCYEEGLEVGKNKKK
jgi:16S rRNA (cytidine1402-2'-O)-methyltransferase